jgi:hypothetical protein
MSPDERERLVRLEEQMRETRANVASMDGKLDQLLEAAAMGKGAWWLLLKVGGVLVLLVGAGAWLVDHFPKFPK